MYKKLAGFREQVVWFDDDSLHYSIGDPFAPASTAPPVSALTTRLRKQAEHQPIRRLMVANTMQCNMTCTYCYNELDLKAVRGSESAGGADPERQRTQLLTAIHEAPETGLAVTFVGGEPLFDRTGLQRTVQALRSAAAARDLPLTLGVYTNGLLMTPSFVDWANDHDVSLVVSLDGPPVEHDQSRRTVGGAPTARRILKNIRYLVDHSSQRLTRVRAVAQGGTDLLMLHRYFLALGFNEIHVQPAYGPDGTTHLSLEEHERIMEWYTSLLLDGCVIDIAPYSNYMMRLARRGKVIQSHYPCDVGIFSAAVDPRGDFFPCHHFFGEPDFAYPSSEPGVLPSPAALAARAQSVDERASCRTCVARHMCGGECYHRAQAGGVGYFGVIADECQTRRDLLAPLLEMFDTVMRKGSDAMLRLTHGDLSSISLDQRAYDCTSLDEFSSLVAR